MSKLGLGHVLTFVLAGASVGLVFTVGCSGTSTGGTETDSGSPANDASSDGPGNQDSGDGATDGGGGDGGSPKLEGPIAKVVGGARHSCAVYKNGALACWGGNDNGQLGLGDTKDRGDSAAPVSGLQPVDLGPGALVAEVSLGQRHTCARLTTGKVKCWGSADQGQLGLDSKTDRGQVPGDMGAKLPEVDLGPGRTAKQISVSGAHSCALLDDNQVKCWGRNATGQLGQGDTQNRGESAGQMAALGTVDVGTGRTVLEVRAGDSFTCVRLDDASVRCWGANGEGELGIGNTDTRGHKPGHMGASLLAVDFGPGRTATSLSVGYYFSCAKLDDGTVKCWGGNAAGQLGLGNQANRGVLAGQMGANLPTVNFGTGRTVKSIDLGQEFGCVRLDDDTTKCWGNGFYGQTGYGSVQKLGDGPGEMGDALGVVDLGASRTAVTLGVGGEHVCALIDNGKVKCWGSNLAAQLGNGNRNAIGDAPNEMGASLANTPLP
ncbi:MAG: hypothetical protein HOO96_24805 [Polyangiaceae bacterium]|nr:hypothetical protein [Polyangiaceae bacterium]